METITDTQHFKRFAERWTEYDHSYNKVLSLLDWSRKEKVVVHKACRGKFFKDSFLMSQKNWNVKAKIHRAVQPERRKIELTTTMNLLARQEEVQDGRTLTNQHKMTEFVLFAMN